MLFDSTANSTTTSAVGVADVERSNSSTAAMTESLSTSAICSS